MFVPSFKKIYIADPIPKARKEHRMVSNNKDTCYIFGGFNNDSKFLADIWSFSRMFICIHWFINYLYVMTVRINQ